MTALAVPGTAAGGSGACARLSADKAAVAEPMDAAVLEPGKDADPSADDVGTGTAEFDVDGVAELVIVARACKAELAANAAVCSEYSCITKQWRPYLSPDFVSPGIERGCRTTDEYNCAISSTRRRTLYQMV